MTKWFVAVAFTGLLLGQGASLPPLNGLEFRALVRRSVAGERIVDTRISEFALQHDDAAVPILIDEIKAQMANRPKQADPKVAAAIFVLVNLATATAGQPAIRAVGELCAAYEDECSFFITTLLNNGMSQEQSYGTAHDFVEQYPQFRKMVIAWIERRLKNGGEFGYALEMQDRAEEGYVIKDDDVIRSQLAPAMRERIMRAFGTLNRQTSLGIPE